MGRDLRVVPAEELWNRGRDSSHDGERDLGLMVTDFIETGGGGSGGAADSWCSSDSDSGFPDPTYLSDKIQVSKLCQNFQNMRRGRGKGRKQDENSRTGCKEGRSCQGEDHLVTKETYPEAK